MKKMLAIQNKSVIFATLKDTDMDEGHKDRRGGARPGAGRKNEGRVCMRVYVSPDTEAALKDVARDRRTAPGRVIDKMVKDMLNDKNDTI